MKKVLVVGLTFLSMNVFSQSYVVLNNGVVLTTDKSGFIYDFGHFSPPYKVTFNGGQFLVEDKKLATVDTNGYLYQKTLKVDKIKGKGYNYFISDDNHLVTVDSKGYFFEYDKDDKVFKKAHTFGGNYFTVKMDDKKPEIDLYTINDKGNYFKMNVEGLNPADIRFLGGAYFQTNSGVTYTVSKDGFVYAKNEISVGTIKRAGGSFFTNMDDLLFSVSEDGFLTLPSLPANLKVSKIQKLGANYMIDSDGKIFVVDKAGAILERTSGHDLRNAKVLSF